MPPRGRPRGGVRGRGRGRGASTVAENPAQPTEESESSALPVETTGTASNPDPIGHSDTEGGIKITHADNSMPDAPESQPEASAGQPTQPSTNPAPSRPPVQRLDSLKNSTVGASRSASPTSRGTSSARGKKPLTRQPVFKGRRSKEEREALAQETLERERERRAEREAETRRINRGFGRGEWRGRGDRGRGRGGYMRDNVPVSGPFSLGRSTAGNEASRRVPTTSTSGGSGSRPRVKREMHGRYDVEEEQLRRSLGIVVKQEADDGGDISSDDDDPMLGPRKDIDQIEAVDNSDDDGEEEGLADKRKKSNGPPLMLPIRIPRKEHHERVIGINTEASSAASAKILKQAEKKGDSSSLEAIESVTRKGKAKVKDVEITDIRRPYKGMWQDPDSEDGVIRIKDEPVSDDEVITVPESIAIGAGDSTQNEALKQTGSSPEAEKKPHKGKGRQGGRSSMYDSNPSLQTEEERQEWSRHQFDLSEIRRELGQTAPAPATAAADQDGDTPMEDGEMKPLDIKADRVYLFQFPPIVPDLWATVVKKEPQDEAAPIITAADQTPIKVEDGESKSASNVSQSSGPTLASGRAGKLRIHESGRATLNWGGTSLELKMGINPHFLQDTVVTRITPENQRVGPGDEGEALGFGQVRGKFVVTPDWYEIVG